jgi:hypothetical protein
MMMMTMLFENRFDDVELDEFDMDCMTAVRFFKLIEKNKNVFFLFFLRKLLVSIKVDGLEVILRRINVNSLTQV